MDFFTEIRMHHATRAKAAKLAALFEAEYPRLSLVAVEGEETDHEIYTHELGGFEVQVDEDNVLLESEKVPELADVLDACAEQEIDPTKDDEEEEEPEFSGSVVKEKYRAAYREASTNGQTCGDWLAERLVDDTTGGAGKLDIDELVAVFEANGVDLSAKWAVARHTGTRGWQGRFRMSGRIVLEKVVVLRGTYISTGGMVVEPPAVWLEAMEAKHEKWLRKERKAAAAALEATKSAVEGE